MKRRWLLIACFWLIQSAVVVFGNAAAWIAADSVNGSAGGSLLGDVPWDEFIDAVTDPGYVARMVIVCVAFIAAQAVFLWPVRKPTPKFARGWSLGLSLGAAGLCIGILAAVIPLAWFGIAYLLNLHEIELYRSARFIVRDATLISTPTGATLASPVEIFTTIVVGTAVLGWIIATPLLIAFCKRGPREGILARVAAWLFTGTMIEVAAIMPIDVMVRRKSDCYCLSTTWFALVACAAVGLFSLGPMIFLLVLSKRRRRWYEGKCDACGYDMSATPRADRCPECGCGWRPVKA